MRIVLAGISHETNTYCSGLTEMSAFHCLRGKQILQAIGQETDVGGAVSACQRLEVEALPLLFAQTQPSATIAREAFESFAQEILDGIEDAQLNGGVDAVVLLLHGAGVAEGIADIEGELATRVRALVGESTPITATFDLHGNISERMCEVLNGVFACHQYPHIDLHVQAEEAVAHAVAMVRNHTFAKCCMVRVPMLLPTTTTFQGIGAEMLQQVLKAESLAPAEAVVDVSWFHGFPYTDIEHVGSTIVVTYFDTPDTGLTKQEALQLANELALELWRQREKFVPISLDADEAVADALRAADVRDAQTGSGPVVIHETSDNCGAGTPGDGTHLLRAMLAADLKDKQGRTACFGFIVDPITAQQAHQAGVGASIEVALGGRTDDLHGEPIQARATVVSLHDGRLVLQHMFKGMPLHLGPLARLQIAGVDVVVGSRRSQTFDKEPFLATGIDVMRYDLVALKSSSHFRACFQSIAHDIVTADPPGLSTHNISVFPRQSTAKAFWPIHPEASFSTTSS